MLNCCIFFDCHGGEIYRYLKQSKKFMKLYKCKIISINKYVNGNENSNNNNLLPEDLEFIENANLLILQIIEKDRGFLNNNEIIKLNKKNCKIIKIPHYRNSVYKYINMGGREDDYIIFKFHPNLKNKWELKNQITDINNVNETINIIKKNINNMNNFSYNIKKMKLSLNNKIDEFKKIDDKSDIKMLDFFNNNYKKYRLFNSRSYPSSFFFYELANRILNKLNIFPKHKFIDNYFATHELYPIPDYWYNFCEFSFDKKMCFSKDIEIEEYEWYYLLLLSNKVENLQSKEDILKLLNIIRK